MHSVLGDYTYDLRNQIVPESSSHHLSMHAEAAYPSDEEHSVLEDDSDGEDRDDYMDDDDGSSSLSIPNESIDFDLVYALHSFAATVAGQANVVKGDSLVLMDDSNSYWWLVRVLKTEEIGYIPAENIETPFERLARLNKHRNVDLAAATQAELQETRDRLRDNLSSRAGSNQATPSPTPGVHAGSRTRSQGTRGVAFTPSLSVHRYPPAVWGDEEEEEDDDEWDVGGYEDEDPELAEEQERERDLSQGGPLETMEPDDGMSWEDGAVLDVQAKHQTDLVGRSPEPPTVEIRQGVQAQPVLLRLDSTQVQQQTVGANQQDHFPAAAQKQTFADRVTIIPDVTPVVTSSSRDMDPANVSETRKITITPQVARDRPSEDISPQHTAPLLPSAILQQQQEERKRTREEIEALEDAARKKGRVKPATTAPDQSKPSGGAKLRKERTPEPVASTDDDNGKKKKSGVFGGLFSRRKDKGKEKNSSISESGSIGSVEFIGRGSEESGRSSQQHVTGATSAEISPITASARQQQQQLAQKGLNDLPRSGQPQTHSPQRPVPQSLSQEGSLHSSSQSTLSQHASQLRQRDQQQQALYQQYLNRSPSSPPQPQSPSISVTLSGSISNSSSNPASGLSPVSSRPRPGSLVLYPTTMEGIDLPDLSVVRIFAGQHLQTEATFKTVLVNSTTTASDLVRQAIQRFRLSVGENEKDYYLTIKQVEGSSAILLPHEHPLVVFESLVEAATELPKVKRSSVGSLSSIASNLSMHPAIKKSMNDFTDDSTVKFYLNRRGDGRPISVPDDEDSTLLAESSFDNDLDTPRSPAQILGDSVNLERFSSPSYKFALQLVIHPEDLPDDMALDPLTEAIVFKGNLRDRSPTAISSPTVPLQRKKVLTFPKNITVAEVIEIGLERFGIMDGVVDGGDEVEDKLAKRRSSMRVRYGLTVDIQGREKELPPASRIIDAYPRPPVYRTYERRTDLKRRSADSAQLLGSPEDVSPEDPVFILRRAVSYRPSSRRLSAPLDDVALQRAQRDSASSSNTTSDSGAGSEDVAKHRQLSKQEVIAAQRAASRANQRAILSAQANSSRGLDVLLPGNAMIRSTRYEVDDKMRYSYVEPDGETYDISDIVESEWRGEAGPRERSDVAKDDLLHGVLSRGKDGLGARLDRVLSKVRHEKSGRAQNQAPVERSNRTSSIRSTSPSLYSTAEGGTDPPGSRSATPNANALNARSPTPTAVGLRVQSPTLGVHYEAEPRSRSRSGSQKSHDRHHSASSAGSDGSTTFHTTSPPASRLDGPQRAQPLYIPTDDFGLANMIAVIELRGKLNRVSLPPLDAVDDLLFGRDLDVKAMHPKIRGIYTDSFKDLEKMDKGLDELLELVAHTF